MALIQSKKIFYINSKDILAGETTSRFTASINLDATDDFDRVALLQAAIPKSYYLIRSGLNTFTLTQDATVTTITIPVGNYTRRSFQSTVENLLNAAATNGRAFAISWPGVNDTVTGKFQYSCSNVGGIEPIFTFTDNNIAECMGFNLNSSNQFSGFALTSVNVINLNLENTLYLHSDICSNGPDDILQEIYVSGDANYTNVVFQNFDVEAYSKKLVSKNKQSFLFFLTDEDSKPIDLNGIGMQLTLILFKSNNIYDYQREFIRYTLLKEEEEKSNKK